MDNRTVASATELANQILDRRVGCVELLDFYLARADRHNPALNAIIVWQIDQARERAAPLMPPSRAASAGDCCAAFQ